MQNFSAAKILTNAGASLHSDSGRMAKMLCNIGACNNMEKLKILVECEADLEAADYDKRTIAHLAASEGHIDMLKYLIEHTDFDFTLKDRWGNEILCELKDNKDKLEI